MHADAAALDASSVVLVWTAIALYVIAFLMYAVDLANRSQAAIVAKDAAVRVSELVGAGAPVTGPVATGSAPAAARTPRRLWARLGTALTVFGFILHLGGTVLRGIAAGRVPWSNMWEFAMTGTLLIISVYLGVLFWRDLRFLGSFMTGLVTVLLGASALLYVPVVPLMDPLKSAWLVIHVFVASLATAFLALAFSLSVLQLLQARRERLAMERDAERSRGALAALPTSESLEGMAYRFAIIGFIFWTFTLIAGSIWANDAWGRYWGFDTKEVWTFIIWVLYAGYIHARATRGWRGNPSAWLSIVGFSAVIFNFAIVNVFFKGLHAYSGLT